MLNSIDDILPGSNPAVSTTLGEGSWTLWIVAGLAGLFLLCLIVGGILARQKNRRLNIAGVKSGPFMSLIKRLLRWLFYPSFQHLFADDDFTNKP